MRLRPQQQNHVWAYDFVAARTSDGRPVRLLTVVDEYTRERLAIRVGRSLRSSHVIECLGDLTVERGVPEHLPSDNGPEFTAKAVRLWLQGVGAKTLFITPWSPSENGYVESFNGKLRDELLLLDREFFDTLWEAQVLTEQWRHEYNHQRPHSALGYRPPAPEAILTSSPAPRPWDPAEHLETGEDMAAYLNVALEEGDLSLIMATLGDIARARKMAIVAEETGLGRESLYKSLSADGNPEFATVLKVVRALGLRLHATAVPGAIGEQDTRSSALPQESSPI